MSSKIMTLPFTASPSPFSSVLFSNIFMNRDPRLEAQPFGMQNICFLPFNFDPATEQACFPLLSLQICSAIRSCSEEQAGWCPHAGYKMLLVQPKARKNYSPYLGNAAAAPMGLYKSTPLKSVVQFQAVCHLLSPLECLPF